MANQRIIVFTVLLTICYLAGETWADAPNIQNNSGAINSSNNNNGNNNNLNISVPSVNKKTETVNKVISTVSTPQQQQPKNNTQPKCVCDGALLPRLDEKGKELEICAECKCKHEARNTTLIKVVVIIVIWIISILVIYMLFLMCLDPLLNKRVKANYQEHTNEDDDATSTEPPLPSSPNQELSSRANVLNRVGHQQDKWKRQVREQRRRIYDRHTMLN